jgi:glucosamine kinase
MLAKWPLFGIMRVMSQTRYVLAVDGGGTKTAAALMTPAGEELAACRSGPANLYRDPAAGLAAIEAAWHELSRQAGLVPEAAAGRTVISAGLAGISGAVQRRAFAAAFAGFAGRRLSSDGYTAFLGVFGTGPGALLAIGTGVIAYRRAPDGALRVLSGWGFPVADRGSGAWLGFRLAGEYLDHLDGCAAIEASPLWAVAEARLGREREAVLAWLKDARAADFAAMVPEIVASAAARDPLATTLLAEGAGHLLRLARALQPTAAAPLCLGGGLAATYRPALEAALGSDALLAERRPDPIRGAWLVAIDRAPPEFPDLS